MMDPYRRKYVGQCHPSSDGPKEEIGITFLNDLAASLRYGKLVISPDGILTNSNPIFFKKIRESKSNAVEKNLTHLPLQYSIKSRWSFSESSNFFSI